MEQFAALMLLGVRVREVRDLEEGSIWLPRRKLLLIADDMPRRARAALADRLTSAAAG